MINIYKPNSKNAGCACSFYLGRDGNVYINAINQHSWNSEKKIGSFSENAKNPEKSVSVKINITECGGIINAIEQISEYSMFHSYKDDKTQISFKPWEKKDGTKAFGLSITRNSIYKFKLPIELSEAIAIREFLKYCLIKNFSSKNQNQTDE